MNIFKRKQTLVISERDPEYKVRYLGNVLTAFVKGEGCVDKPTQVLWNNYLTNSASNPTGEAGLDMEMRVCSTGLKVITKEQGLTEYRAHRITYSLCPQSHPKLFVWVYRHDGKKLKPEVRCHAVLCKTDQIARMIASQLTARRTIALDEFRRDKKRRQNSRIELMTRSTSATSEVTCPGGGGAVRTKFLATGQNFRPSIDRSTSAPRLGSITEGIEEEPSTEDVMRMKRRSMLFPVRVSRLSDDWLPEEEDDVSTTVSFSIARDVEQIPSMEHRLSNGNDQDTVFITNERLAMGVAGGFDVTEMSQGLGSGPDSDNDSTESGFSEQDGSALD